MGTWTRVVRATSAAHSRESATAAAMHVLTRCLSAAAICDRAAMAAQTVVVFSQVAATTSASGIAASKSGTIVVCSTAAALALMEAAHDHVKAAHAQLVAAFSKEMGDVDGKMLAEYGAMDAMEHLPQSTVGRELDMEEATEIDEHQSQ